MSVVCFVIVLGVLLVVSREALDVVSYARS